MIQMPMLAIILVFAHLLIVPQIYCQFFTFNPISNSVKDTNKKRQPVKQTEKEHDQLHNIYDNFEKIEDSFTKKLNPDDINDFSTVISSDKEKLLKSGSDFMGMDFEKASQLLSHVNYAQTSANDDFENLQNLALNGMLNITSENTENSVAENSVEKTNNKDNAAVLNEFFHNLTNPSSLISNDIFQSDYSTLCPKGFFAVKEDCWPSDEYSGLCNSIQRKLVGIPDTQKQAWEHNCRSIWGVLPEECPNGVNWYKTCPVGWMENSEGECYSLINGVPEGCPLKFRFSDYNVSRKKILSSRCSLRWPCYPVECKVDYSHSCPKDWKLLENNVCMASESYKGPCPRYARIKNFSDELKKNFEIVCFVTWPCDNSCHRNFTVTCPLGWIEKDSRTCIAPVDYTGPLPLEYNFKFLSSETREHLSKKLNIEYPCLDRSHCQWDLTVACPVGWVASSEGNGCYASVRHLIFEWNKNTTCLQSVSRGNTLPRHNRFQSSRYDDITALV